MDEESFDISLYRQNSQEEYYSEQERNRLNKQLQNKIEDYANTKMKILKTRATAEEQKRLIQGLRDKILELQGELREQKLEHKRIYSLAGLPETATVNDFKEKMQSLNDAKSILDKIGNTLNVKNGNLSSIDQKVNELNAAMNEVSAITNATLQKTPPIIKQLQYEQAENRKQLRHLAGMLNLNKKDATFYDLQQEVSNIISSNASLIKKVKEKDDLLAELRNQSEAGIKKLISEKNTLIENEAELCRITHSKNPEDLKKSIKRIVSTNITNGKNSEVLAKMLECSQSDIVQSVKKIVDNFSSDTKILKDLCVRLETNNDEIIGTVENLQASLRKRNLELESQKETNNYLEKEKLEYQKSISENRELIRKLESESIDKDTEILCHATLIKVKEAEISKCEAQIKQMEAELSTHANNLSRSDLENDQKDEQLKQSSLEMFCLRNAIKDYELKVLNKDNEISEMAFNVEDLSTHIEELQKSIIKMEKDIEKYKKQISETENNNERITIENNQLKSQLKNQKDFENVLNRNQELEEQLENSLTEFEYYKKETQNQLQRLSLSLAFLENSAKDTLAKSDEIDSLKDILEQTTFDVQEKESTILDLEDYIEKVQKDFKQLKFENINLLNKYKNLEVEKQSLQNQLKQIQSEEDKIKSLENSLKYGDENNIAYMNAMKTISNLSKQLTEAKDMVQDCNRKISESEARLESVYNDNKVLGNRIVALKKEKEMLVQEAMCEKERSAAAGQSENKLSQMLEKEQIAKKILEERNHLLNVKLAEYESKLRYTSSANDGALSEPGVIHRESSFNSSKSSQNSSIEFIGTFYQDDNASLNKSLSDSLEDYDIEDDNELTSSSQLSADSPYKNSRHTEVRSSSIISQNNLTGRYHNYASSLSTPQIDYTNKSEKQPSVLKEISRVRSMVGSLSMRVSNQKLSSPSINSAYKPFSVSKKDFPLDERFRTPTVGGYNRRNDSPI